MDEPELKFSDEYEPDDGPFDPGDVGVIREGWPVCVRSEHAEIAKRLGVHTPSLWRKLNTDGLLPGPTLSPNEAEFLLQAWLPPMRGRKWIGSVEESE